MKPNLKKALALNKQSKQDQTAEPTRPTRRFKQRTFRMGAMQNFRWDKALAVATAMEDEEVSLKVARGG